MVGIGEESDENGLVATASETIYIWMFIIFLWILNLDILIE